MELLMKIEGFGYYWALFLKGLYLLYPFWVFFESLVFLFFVTKIELCLTSSITSKNKGVGGSDPLEDFQN